MIEVRDLTKRFGDKVAVDHLSFSVEPGRVTGFLGPNGAGKSTTMRLILGLDRPQSGTATIDGKRYNQLPRPLETVGALLEAKAMHTGRSAYNHLLFLAQSQGLPARRVDEVLAQAVRNNFDLIIINPEDLCAAPDPISSTELRVPCVEVRAPGQQPDPARLRASRSDRAAVR